MRVPQLVFAALGRLGLSRNVAIVDLWPYEVQPIDYEQEAHDVKDPRTGEGRPEMEVRKLVEEYAARDAAPDDEIRLRCARDEEARTEDEHT